MLPAAPRGMTPRRMRRGGLTAALLLLTACASPALDRDAEESAQLSQRFKVAPNASIAIIPEDAAFPEWQIRVVRHLIGGGFGDDSTLGFQPPHSAAILDDGSFFVASYRPPFVRFPGDRPGVEHIGRAGEGPGEYRQIQWVRRFRGDSLRIWDGMLRKLVTLDPEGRAVAEVRPTPQLRNAFEFWPTHHFEDGRVVGFARASMPPSAGNLIIQGDLLLLDSTHTMVQYLGKDVPIGEESYTEAPKQRGLDKVYSVHSPPFRRRGLVAAGGHRWCYTWIGSADLYCGSSDGMQVAIARDTTTLAAVTDTMMLQHIEDLGLLNVAPEQRQRSIDGMTKLWLHQVLPRWSHMVVDDQERIWLQRFRNPLDSLERVLMLDRDFAPVARFDLERGWQILAARGQTLVVAKKTGNGSVVRVLSVVREKA